MMRRNGGYLGVVNVASKSGTYGIWSLAEHAAAKKENIWPVVKVNVTLSITANARNINARTLAIAAGYDGVTPINLTMSVSAGVVVGSASTSTPALDLRGFPVDSTISLTVGSAAYVVGAGGAAGNGAAWDQTPGNGQIGGDAIKADRETVITNLGTVAGGAGGGGGGRGYTSDGSYGCTGGNGGGGAGDIVAGSASLTTGQNGSPGVVRPDGFEAGGAGGKGGNLGSAGAYGEDRPANFNGSRPAQASGGAAGYYMRGNAFVTWATVGTRLGNLAS